MSSWGISSIFGRNDGSKGSTTKQNTIPINTMEHSISMIQLREVYFTLLVKLNANLLMTANFGISNLWFGSFL